MPLTTIVLRNRTMRSVVIQDSSEARRGEVKSGESIDHSRRIDLCRRLSQETRMTVIPLKCR